MPRKHKKAKGARHGLPSASASAKAAVKSGGDFDNFEDDIPF